MRRDDDLLTLHMDRDPFSTSKNMPLAPSDAIITIGPTNTRARKHLVGLSFASGCDKEGFLK